MDETSRLIKNHLGYTDEEMGMFMANPRNMDVINKAPELMKKTIIIEVVEAHGCNSRHQAGDRFYFDGAGNLLTKLNPKRICAFALSPIVSLIFGVHEMIYAGIDPNTMRFKRTGCFDTGIRCGGWGHIVMEVKVEER